MLKQAPTPLHSTPTSSDLSSSSSQTLYVPIESPPTPAPSPGPTQSLSYPSSLSSFSHNYTLPPLSAPTLRRTFLTSIIHQCTPSELLFISSTIAPLLKRDFLKALPAELALYVLSFVDDPKTLVRAGGVSRYWRGLVGDESVWRGMCVRWEFPTPRRARRLFPEVEQEWTVSAQNRRHPPLSLTPSSSSSIPRSPTPHPFSYAHHFKQSYQTLHNWRTKSHLLRTHTLGDSGVVTSLAIDEEWVVVGLASSLVNVFSAKTGVLARTLVGHELGVWGVCLISRGGWVKGREKRGRGGESGVESARRGLERLRLEEGEQNEEGAEEGEWRRLNRRMRYAVGLDPAFNSDFDLDEGEEGEEEEYEEEWEEEDERSSETFASRGWGQPHALVVSGGCDKVVRVWDVDSGECIYTLPGHTSTVRCLRVLHNRPIAVSGSRDCTLRVWDVQKGRCVRVLEGHTQSVRCLDVVGSVVVSGSYDTTCRVWNVDTGECLHVLRGHYHQIYSVVFDGTRIASGGLDTTVRVWDAQTGQCLALLQGHTALVCQLQLLPSSPSHSSSPSPLPPLLATGGSDGRVITFALDTYTIQHRIAAHDSSVSSLQFDHRFLVTGGNDGRVRLYDVREGNYVRDLSELGESVWKVGYCGDVLGVMCKRGGRTVMEIWSMKPRER